MALLETLEKDLIESMKAKDADKLGVLRLVKAAVTNYKIDKKKEVLEDSEISEIIQKQVKQRRESIESFEKAGRTDLAQKEKTELLILEKYLPKQLTDDEIKALAVRAIESSGAKTKAEIGKVMKDLMPAVKGKADGKRVNEILGTLLS